MNVFSYGNNTEVTGARSGDEVKPVMELFDIGFSDDTACL